MLEIGGRTRAARNAGSVALLSPQGSHVGIVIEPFKGSFHCAEDDVTLAIAVANSGSLPAATRRPGLNLDDLVGVHADDSLLLAHLFFEHDKHVAYSTSCKPVLFSQARHASANWACASSRVSAEPIDASVMHVIDHCQRSPFS